MSEAKPTYNLVVCGFGPAGMGPIVQAAKHRAAFDDLLDAGICVVDASPTDGGTGKFGDYLIRPNNPPSHPIDIFKESADEHPVMGRIRASPEYASLLKQVESGAESSLIESGRLLRIAATELLGLLKLHPACKVNLASECTALTLPSEGVEYSEINVVDHSSRELLTVRARHVVLALGGIQRIPAALAEAFHGKVWGADDVQRMGGWLDLRQRLEADAAARAGPARVTIIGGSHGAFSVAKLLLDNLGPNVRVTVVHGHPIRVMFLNRTFAAVAGYESWKGDPNAIDESGVIYRVRGIQAAAKELYLACRKGQERRLTFKQVPGEELSAVDGPCFKMCEQADVIIPALGYNPRMLKLFRKGQADALQWALARDGQLKVCRDTAHLALEDAMQGHHVFLPRVYGIGLGCGLPLGGVIGDPGARLDGLRVYSGPVGDLVLAAVQPTIPEAACHAAAAKSLSAALLAVKFHVKLRAHMNRRRIRKMITADLQDAATSPMVVHHCSSACGWDTGTFRDFVDLDTPKRPARKRDAYWRGATAASVIAIVSTAAALLMLRGRSRTQF